MTPNETMDAYLERLRVAARRLPPGRAEELVDEITRHVDDALAAAGGRDEATIRTVLDRLGPPEAIVEAEAEAGPAPEPPDGAVRPSRRWGAIEISAAVLMTVGMILLPVIGPLIGLVFAWASSIWTTREKIVLTVVVVVLVGLPLVGLLGTGAGSEVSSGTSQPSVAP